MAINLKLDLMGNPEPPSIVLANRNGNKLGQLDVDVKSIDVKDLLGASEFTFTLNKYIDGELTPLWDKVVDFKLVYCPEWDLWYGIKVELDEATETVKTVFCTQLGQEELSQIKVYNIEINTEADIARDDYKISILYDEDNPDASILHRVMSKAPHYSIAYVDESLKRIQKSFSFDDASICDVFDEIKEEVGCLVVYNSNSDKNGMPKRDVSIYDLLQNCKNPNCKHRGEFTDKCPKCGSTDIDYGYGEDTTIFVTSDELATQGIELVTDTDSVKNCFKLEAGDDLMTATIRNCNPNGSDYIWYFSDAVKEDMSKELVEAIESYDAKYKEYYDAHTSNLDASLVSKYNALVEKYKEYYNTPSTCINCDYEGEFENECPSCHSGNILSGKSLQAIDTPINGYSALMNAYYNTIDLALYLESGLMPNVEMSDTKAEEQVKLLTSSSLSPVAVNVEKIDSVSLATANSAVLSMAKVIIRPTYKVEISTSTLSDNKVWSGQFIVTNYSDETDTATSDTVNVTINNETEDFIEQKIEKALNKENTDDLSISGLFNEDKYDYDAFCAELKKYALNPLKSFYDACDTCLSILTEQGAGDKNEKLDLYENLYEPYYKRSQAIAEEIKLREDEIAVIKGMYNESDERNRVLISEGLQTNIEDCRKEIQDALNFEEYLGKDLWLELCAYRREDKYSNSNYVSDGLNNAELFERASEFVEVAENEIFKSAELQHSISANLNNLLSHPKFKPLIKCFKTGNWIRVRVDDRIFKLRLLEYNFSYGDLESIPVEFSDVTKIKNGTTDVQDVFSQAASMASSYDAVQRQAKKGDVARSTIDQWLVDGLNAANVQIQSNDSEEVLLTKNGLLARSYSDITGTYSPEQLKITHNIMAYTDDNWETVRQAIGKHDYKFYDENVNDFVDETGYGMNADFVTAGVVSGSQIIGGNIYSDNYSITDRAGSYLNLRDGTFSFGGGSLRFEKDEDGEAKLLISSPSIPTTDTITEINEEYLKTTTVYAENLQVNAAKIQNQLTASQINTKGLIAENISSTTIDGKTITGGSIFIGDTTKVGDYAEITNDGALTCTNVDIKGGMFTIGSKDNEETHTWITSDGTLNTYNANISGEIRAASGSIGGFTIEPVKDENGDAVGGWLYSSGKTLGENKSIFLSATDMNGTMPFPQLVAITDENGDVVFDENGEVIYETTSTDLEMDNWRITVGTNFGVTSDGTAYMSNCEIVGGSLKMGNEANGYHTWISEDGILNANGANIDGTIIAAEGAIGNCKINSDGSITSANGNFSVDAQGNLTAVGNGSIGGFIIGGKSIYHTKTSYDETDNDGVYLGTDGIGLGKGMFSVDASGNLIARNAEINGVITAKTGYIGYEDESNTGWKISSNTISGGGVSLYTGDDYVENAGKIRISIGDNSDLALNPFKVFDSGYFVASNGAIGSCAFQNPVLPKVGKDLGNIDDYKICNLPPPSGSSSRTLSYKVRWSPSDEYSIKTFEPYYHETNWLIYSYDRYAWYYVWTDSPNAPDNLESLDWSEVAWEPFVDVDFNIIRTHPYLWFKCYVMHPDDPSDINTTYSDIDTVYYYIGDFSGYLTVFNFGDNSLSIGENIITGNASSIKFNNDDGCLLGSWYYGDAEIATKSWRGAKSNIEELDNRYSVLFDRLRPVRFTYNNGQSQRYHTGIILDELKAAMDEAGVDTSELAAYCISNEVTGEGGIRYSELIALCIEQIQKLKGRVSELENK